MRVVEKVCPVVIRLRDLDRELLVFRHPLAGVQIAKGTLEAGEDIEAGTLRELAEEAGVVGEILLGSGWSSGEIVSGQLWHFKLVTAVKLPDNFTFRTSDDGGHDFAFFWWPIEQEPSREWAPAFVRALHEVQRYAGR